MPPAAPARSPLEIAALKTVGLGRAIAVILLASLLVFGFLVWLIYFKPAAAVAPRIVASLGGVNALLNATSATFIVLGFLAIKRGEYVRHSKLMLGALASSALFLVCYVVYHAFHGDTRFRPGAPMDAVKAVYFFILISHIFLSAVAVPLILTSFYLSLAGKLAAHRKVSKFTLPIWLYVSVTGVLVYIILKTLNTPVV